MVIGHEIAHSIEINSKKYLSSNPDQLVSDSNDKEDSDFSNNTFNELYRKKATCFTEEFSKFKLDDVDDYVSFNNLAIFF